ncbi:MAG: asparagine synthase (glutamine-hydrolyzing) [Candidatus Azotimanducaceae bacterium]|jgi:asparagine synthase (glutamine-hydrolysing)
MTAIAGILRPGVGSLEESGLQAMLSVMARRGVERHLEVKTDRALATLSNNNSALPGQYHFRQDDFSIVGDLRLDERAALARRVRLGDNCGDAQLVLAAYRKFGAAVTDHLLGDFSFLITDGRSVFCARDHLGVKPFYYGICGNLFVIGSEAAAVRLVLNTPINQTRIADFLVFPLEHVDQTSTFYQGVLRLPAASRLIVRDGQAVVTEYWHADPDLEVRYQRDEDYVSAFREHFQSSIANRIGQRDKIASMLSGGVDSSTVVGFSNRIVPATTFSTVELDEKCSETEHIRVTTEFLGQSANMISRRDANASLGEVFRCVQEALVEPFDYYMIQSMLVNQAASRAGFDLLLDGLEGDMLHSVSSNYPSTLMRSGQWLTGLKEVCYLRKNAFGGEPSLWSFYFERIRQIGLPSTLAFLRGFKQRLVAASDPLQGSLISVPFAREQRVQERLTAASQVLYGGSRSLQQQHAANVNHPAISAAAERYDRVGGMFGVTPCHPLMDKRLVEFSLSIPREQKTQHGWSKYHLRRIGDGLIPREVSWRVGREENAWRFIDLMTEVHRNEMTEAIRDDRYLLEPYIAANPLNRLCDDDLLELYGLLCWLKRNR